MLTRQVTGLAIVAVTLIGTPLVAADASTPPPGTLDTTFNTTGIARHHYATSESSNAVVPLADGSVALAGKVRDGGGNDQITVFHVDSAGSDASWATRTLGCGYPGEAAVAMKQSGSQLVVAGYSQHYGLSDSGFCVGAIDPSNGNVITAFGTNGTTRTAFPAGYSVTPRAIAVDGAGNILVVGDDADNPPAGENARAFAARYTADGQPDTGFGLNGITMINFGSTGYYSAQSVVSTANGFVVAGSDGGKSVLLTRLKADGTTDTTFGSSGLAQATFGTNYFQPADLVVDSAGGLVASVYVALNDFGAIRFDGNGSRDNTFGTNGLTRINFGDALNNPNDAPHGLVVDESGRLVIGGTSTAGGGSRWVMTRLQPNGQLDTGFGSGGLVQTPIGVDDHGNALAIDDSHRLLQTGTVNDNTGSGADVAVARFVGGDGPTTADVVAHIAQASPGTVTPGGVTSFNVGAENLGPAAAANATVTFLVPTGTSLSTTTPSCTYNTDATVVTCPLGNLPSGGSNAASVSVFVPSTYGATLRADVSAASDTSDPEGTNNSTYVTVPVADITPPSITLTSPTASTYELGDNVTADYSCSDDRGAPATCAGPVASGDPIDTSSVGTHTFTVNSTDAAGNPNSSSIQYQVVSTTTGSVSDGGSVSTQTPVDASTPVGTQVDVPSGLSGDVTIVASGDVTLSSTSTYTVLGQQLHIEAPVATWDSPLVLTFTLDSSLVAGRPLSSIDIIRDGVVVTDCPGATQANPDGSPCVTDRQLDLATGDATFTVLTAHASTWNFAVVNDTTAPVISITRPVDGAVYTLGQNVLASYSCTDETGGSGVAACTGPVASGAAINTSSVGAKTFTVNSTDNAGNHSTKTAHYSVVYAFRGFLAPVANPPVVNLVSSGKGVPLRFSLSGNKGLSVVTSVTSASTSCVAGAKQNRLDETVTGDGSLRYTASKDQYEYRWGTQKSWQKTCRTLTMTLLDGTQHTATFQFL